MAVFGAHTINTIKEATLETLWPTRCCICDKQNYLLCPQCAAKLPYIDNNKSCTTCGEPFGDIQCCGCVPLDKTLTEEEKLSYSPNYDQCISVFMLTKQTGRIITLYKDAGERRLSNIMSYFMFCAIPVEWKLNNLKIIFIPSTKEAFNRRGFDHSQLLAENLSKYLGIETLNMFFRPSSKDQRSLGRKERAHNLNNRFKISKRFCNRSLKNTSALLIDDVYTTGSTLNSASKALKNFGFDKVFCLTFARTF